MDLRGRWVLVTGASSGLGRAMAGILARQHGANVIPVARRADRLEALKRELEAETKVAVEPIAADLSRTAEVDRVLLEALRRPVYGAVLNAGVTHFGEHRALPWEAFESMLQTNVSGLVRMTNALVPYLAEMAPGGGILLVSSMAGIMPLPYQAAYSGTKAFAVHFGRALRQELGATDVSITVYAPGGIDTEMTSGESFRALRRWLMPVEEAARQGIEAFRRRKELHVPGASSKLGALLWRVLPQRFVMSRVAASYRRALGLARIG
jgi:short-subunit dehydrogenase